MFGISLRMVVILFFCSLDLLYVLVLLIEEGKGNFKIFFKDFIVFFLYKGLGMVLFCFG